MDKQYPTPIFDDAHDEKRRKKEEAERLLQQQREENRRRMPRTAALVDEITRLFGPGCRVHWAIENGQVMGSPPQEARDRLLKPKAKGSE